MKCRYRFAVLFFSFIYCFALQGNQNYYDEAKNNATTITIPAQQLSSDGVNGIRFVGVNSGSGSSDDDNDKHKRSYKGGVDPEFGLWTRGSVNDEDLFQLPHETALPYTEAGDRERQARQNLLMHILMTQSRELEKEALLQLLEPIISYSGRRAETDPRTETDQLRDFEFLQTGFNEQIPGIVEYGGGSGKSKGKSKESGASSSRSGAGGGIIQKGFSYISCCFGGQGGVGGDDGGDPHKKRPQKLKAQCEEECSVSVIDDDNEQTALLSQESGATKVEVELYQVDMTEPTVNEETAAGIEIIPGVWRSGRDVPSDEVSNNCHEWVYIKTNEGAQEIELSFPANLICGICFGLMASPTYSCKNQNHLYCSSCLSKSNITTCPACGDESPEVQVVCGLIQQQINKLEVSCPQCKRDMTLSDIADHLNRHCLQRPVTCPGCHSSINRSPDVLKEHTESCLVSGNQSEGERLYVEFIQAVISISDQNHAVTELPANQCPDCNEQFSPTFYEEHRPKCPQTKIECKHCGIIVIRQVYEEEHGDQCPDRVVECSVSNCNQCWVQGDPGPMPHCIKLGNNDYHNEDEEGIRYIRDDGYQSVVFFASGNRLKEKMNAAYTLPKWNLLIGFWVEDQVVVTQLTYRDSRIKTGMTKGKLVSIELFSASGGELEKKVFESNLLNYSLDCRDKDKSACCRIRVSSDLRGQSLYFRLSLLPATGNRGLCAFLQYDMLKTFLPLALPECDRPQ